MGVDKMQIVTESGLKITYHNPNPTEEVAKLLIQIVAESMYMRVTGKELEPTED